jgi:hypothetical protein
LRMERSRRRYDESGDNPKTLDATPETKIG